MWPLVGLLRLRVMIFLPSNVETTTLGLQPKAFTRSAYENYLRSDENGIKYEGVAPLGLWALRRGKWFDHQLHVSVTHCDIAPFALGFVHLHSCCHYELEVQCWLPVIT